MRLNLNNVAKSSAEPNSFELCRDTATSRRNVAKSSAEPNSFELCRDVVKNVQWTYVAGAVIVDTVVYLWSRAAHPLSRGVRRQAGGMYKRGKNHELITSK